MYNSLVAQDSTHRGFYRTIPLYMLRRYIDLHALLVNNFEHRVLRIEPNDTAVQKCAIDSRSLEFASR